MFLLSWPTRKKRKSMSAVTSRLYYRLSSPNIITYFEKNCLISTKYDMIVLLSPKFQLSRRIRKIAKSAISYVMSSFRPSVLM